MILYTAEMDTTEHYKHIYARYTFLDNFHTQKEAALKTEERELHQSDHLLEFEVKAPRRGNSNQ